MWSSPVSLSLMTIEIIQNEEIRNLLLAWQFSMWGIELLETFL